MAWRVVVGSHPFQGSKPCSHVGRLDLAPHEDRRRQQAFVAREDDAQTGRREAVTHIAGAAGEAGAQLQDRVALGGPVHLRIGRRGRSSDRRAAAGSAAMRSVSSGTSKPRPAWSAGRPRGVAKARLEAPTGGTSAAPSASLDAALRPAALIPARGSLFAAAVNETSTPPASAQGAAVAQIHLIRERRERKRTARLPHSNATARPILRPSAHEWSIGPYG